MAGLHRLTGDLARPQGAAAPVSTVATRPTVEIVTEPAVVEVITDGERPVVEIVTDGASAVVHVVEPVLVDLDAFDLDLNDLVDVDVGDEPGGVPLLVRRGVDGVYRLEPFNPDAASGIGFRHDQFVPASLWQVVHGMSFDPAGVVIRDTGNTMIEPDEINYTLPGVVELRFGAPVAGTAWLS